MLGKDRRKRLHDLCDELNSTLLEGTGRQLRHESDGASRSRSLFITMIQSLATDVSAALFATLDESFDSVPSWSIAVKSSPPKQASVPQNDGRCRPRLQLPTLLLCATRHSWSAKQSRSLLSWPRSHRQRLRHLLSALIFSMTLTKKMKQSLRPKLRRPQSKLFSWTATVMTIFQKASFAKRQPTPPTT